MRSWNRLVHDAARWVARRTDSSMYGEAAFPFGGVSETTQSAATEYDKSVSLFQRYISDSELYETFERNPLASVIIADVTEDAFTRGFMVCRIAYDQDTGVFNKVESKSFNTKIQLLYNQSLKKEVIKSHKLARLFGYSLLLLGYDDGLDLSLPPNPQAEIKFVQAISKRWIEEIEYEKNAQGEVYLPIRIKRYKIRAGSAATKYIHPSRVIHVENPGINSMMTGVSAILPCYDDLLVLKHVTWGAGQTMWRSGNQLVAVIAPPRADPTQIRMIDAALTNLNAQSAITLPFGAVMNAYAPSGLNPEPYANIPLNNIAAATRIPISILIGSQAGALSASLTDQRDYAATLASIQSNVLTPILTKLLKKFMYTGQLNSTAFEIEWASTLTMSEAERTLSEYRQALTKRINNQTEAEAAQAKEERNLNGYTGAYPQLKETAALTAAGTNQTNDPNTGAAFTTVQATVV